MSNETLKINTSEVHNGNQPASGQHTGGEHKQGEHHQKSGQQPGNPQHATPRHNDDPQKQSAPAYPKDNYGKPGQDAAQPIHEPKGGATHEKR